VLNLIHQVINTNQSCWTTHIRFTWSWQFAQLVPQTSAPTNAYPRILSAIRMVASNYIVSICYCKQLLTGLSI